MRIKVSGKILSKTNHEKVFYTHEMYSMLLGTMNPDRAKKFIISNLKSFDCLHFQIST